MALVGLKRASELTGKNQSTIHRAMKAGRLSYSLSDSGERLLDTSELNRLFPVKSDDDALRNDAPAEHRNDAPAGDLRARLTSAAANRYAGSGQGRSAFRARPAAFGDRDAGSAGKAAD